MLAGSDRSLLVRNDAAAVAAAAVLQSGFFPFREDIYLFEAFMLLRSPVIKTRVRRV
jgi:hypothetical protein